MGFNSIGSKGPEMDGLLPQSVGNEGPLALSSPLALSENVANDGLALHP